MTCVMVSGTGTFCDVCQRSSRSRGLLAGQLLLPAQHQRQSEPGTACPKPEEQRFASSAAHVHVQELVVGLLATSGAKNGPMGADINKNTYTPQWAKQESSLAHKSELWAIVILPAYNTDVLGCIRHRAIARYRLATSA